MSQTIINDVPPYTQAQASGGQTVFDTNWTANAQSDVVVYVTPVNTQPSDVDNILFYPTDFSVSFVGALQQVRVTLVTPSTLGDIVTITRMTPADRENLYSNTNFLPSMLNNDFGILTLVDQQNQLVNQQIAPRYNYSATVDPVIDGILPKLSANEIWIKNNNNTGFIALQIQGGQVGSGTVNLGSQNEIAYYAANGNEVSGIPTSGDSVLVTNSGGAPGMSDILPNSITADDMILNTPVITGGSIDNANLNSVTLVTSALGTPTSGVLTNCTGLPSGTGIKCTSTNNDASSGQLGEFISSVIPSGSAVVVASGTASTITSISLTEGDWDVWGNVSWIGLGFNPIYTSAWTSASQNTLIDISLRSEIRISGSILAPDIGLCAPFKRYSLSTTTPIYLSGIVGNTSGNVTQCGGIYARRVR